MAKIGLFITLVFVTTLSYGTDQRTSVYQTKEVVFSSHSAQLSGTLVLPINKQAVAAVVFIHGSGKQTRFLQGAERFAQDGIAALVYDKRGVGESGGEFEGKNPVSEKNLKLLADDALAAFKVLAKHPKLKNLPLGLTGISQAGWIAPIAAEKALSSDSANVDFMVLWSGPVCKVSEEDIFSKYTKDLDSGIVPSYKEALDARLLPYVWPSFLGEDTNPNDSLKKLNIPGLWVFGAKDGSVPVDLSIERLNALKQSGLPYEYVLFSDAGHNNMKVSFSMVTDWIRNLEWNI
ncbi:alpha/beta hydrolase family protein [Ningiella sp. W23]|uniref:alpha/beta hydrolase family protein n=1 Tax=Ningiella sp. W23 TaxID=3023715 RepID=UPI0037577690